MYNKQTKICISTKFKITKLYNHLISSNRHAFEVKIAFSLVGDVVARALTRSSLKFPTRSFLSHETCATECNSKTIVSPTRCLFTFCVNTHGKHRRTSTCDYYYYKLFGRELELSTPYITSFLWFPLHIFLQFNYFHQNFKRDVRFHCQLPTDYSDSCQVVLNSPRSWQVCFRTTLTSFWKMSGQLRSGRSPLSLRCLSARFFSRFCWSIPSLVVRKLRWSFSCQINDSDLNCSWSLPSCKSVTRLSLNIYMS